MQFHEAMNARSAGDWCEKESSDDTCCDGLNGFGGDASCEGGSGVDASVPGPGSPEVADWLFEGLSVGFGKMFGGDPSESGDFEGQGAKCHQINFSSVDDVNAALAQVDQIRRELLGDGLRSLNDFLDLYKGFAQGRELLRIEAGGDVLNDVLVVTEGA